MSRSITNRLIVFFLILLIITIGVLFSQYINLNPVIKEINLNKSYTLAGNNILRTNSIEVHSFGTGGSVSVYYVIPSGTQLNLSNLNITTYFSLSKQGNTNPLWSNRSIPYLPAESSYTFKMGMNIGSYDLLTRTYMSSGSVNILNLTDLISKANLSMVIMIKLPEPVTLYFPIYVESFGLVTVCVKLMWNRKDDWELD